MTPDAMITMIKGRLANSQDSSLNPLIITVANVVQERFEQEAELPWFLFVDTNVAATNLSTVASTETVALPSDFLREFDEFDGALYRQDTTADDPWVCLINDEYPVIKAGLSDDGEGPPTYYDILGSSIYLRQIPDAVYTLRLLYYKSEDDIEAGTTENQWMKYASDWIMAETGFILASDYVVMPAIAQHFEKEALRARKRVYVETVARREAGKMRQMGDD